MSTYLSSLLTTTQRFRNLLPSGDSDGDTTDDTHICRVLRAYYTEKGRAFPSWLPPDPKSTPAAMLPQNNYGNVGAGYGNSGGNKLGSLWDTPSSQPQQQQQPQSLRQGRVPVGGGTGGSASLRAGGLQRGRDGRGGGSEEQYAPRPLPSQRDGSYQTAPPPMLQQVSSAGSAQDRLKNRLFGGKSGSNSPAPGAPGLQPPRGNLMREGSYESGRQDRLDRPPAMGANAPWSSGGDPYSQDPRRQQGGQRGYR